MTGSKATRNPRRPHERLVKLYGRAHAALEAMEGEIDSLTERGEMDGDPKEGMEASEWAGRLADLKWMAENLEWRIDECDDGEAGGPPDPEGGAGGPASAAASPQPPENPPAWRVRLEQMRQSASNRSGSGPESPPEAP